MTEPQPPKRIDAVSLTEAERKVDEYLALHPGQVVEVYIKGKLAWRVSIDARRRLRYT